MTGTRRLQKKVTASHTVAFTHSATMATIFPHPKPIKSPRALHHQSRHFILSTLIPDRIRLLIENQPCNNAFYWRAKY